MTSSAGYSGGPSGAARGSAAGAARRPCPVAPTTGTISSNSPERAAPRRAAAPRRGRRRVDLVHHADRGRACGRDLVLVDERVAPPDARRRVDDVDHEVDPVDRVADELVQPGPSSVLGLWNPGVSVNTTCARRWIQIARMPRAGRLRLVGDDRDLLRRRARSRAWTCRRSDARRPRRSPLRKPVIDCRSSRARTASGSRSPSAHVSRSRRPCVSATTSDRRSELPQHLPAGPAGRGRGARRRSPPRPRRTVVRPRDHRGRRRSARRRPTRDSSRSRRSAPREDPAAGERSRRRP